MQLTGVRVCLTKTVHKYVVTENDWVMPWDAIVPMNGKRETVISYRQVPFT